MAKVRAAMRRLVEHRRFPLALGVAAILLMLPALRAGLLGDDIIQRLAQLSPEQVPLRMLDTGFVPDESGKLPTVLFRLFAYLPNPEAAMRARDYGIAPWWTREGWQASLFRPVTAFTHWLDYRLFPNTPSLMHAHSIGWFAAVVCLVAMVYRTIFTSFTRPLSSPWSLDSSNAGGVDSLRVTSRARLQSGVWVPAVAAALFLLDKNTYFPVMYVANRGFIISLLFGLLCLHAHLRWRRSASAGWMCLSALLLMLSLLANEGGASTLAFLIAYAFVLEGGGWRKRLASLLPAALVMLCWRAIYVACGFGVRNLTLYVDPGYEPWLFVRNIAARANALLGGQLSGVPPELSLGLHPAWQAALAAFFAVFNLLCVTAFLPVMRKDPVARFWGAVALLAVIPAATVYPLSKNLAFVAVGAFGVIASFLVWFAAPLERVALSAPARLLSGFAVFLLLFAHVPGAICGRTLLALASPYIPKMAAHACSFHRGPDIGERDVIVINDPTILAAMVPFERAYRNQPPPRTIRILIPGSTRFEVRRPDGSTLVLKALESDLFDSPQVGPIHLCYCFKNGNDFLFGERIWKAGDRVVQRSFAAEVLDVSPRGAPRAVAFHFDRPLESAEAVWLFFDWRRLTHSPFALPGVGEMVEIVGPVR